MKKSNPPAMVLRDGPLKASIWENEGENGSFLSVSFSKTYTKDGQPKDGHSFSRSDLLPLSELMRKSYTRTAYVPKADSQPEASHPTSGAD